MINAPERIWAANDLKRGHSLAVKGHVGSFPQTEYVRADLVIAMHPLASMGQAQEAYEAQLKAEALNDDQWQEVKP